MNAEQVIAACSNLLLAAAAQNHVAVLKSLLELQNLPIDIFYDYVSGTQQSAPKRRTLAMIAAHHGCIEALAYLLAQGANPNVQSSSDGFTALHCAAEGSSSKTAEVIAYLLSAGAERDMADMFGRKPIDLLLAANQLQSSDDCGSCSGCSTPSVSELDKSEYQADDFRMFGFKVMKCTRAKAHDWTECPFAHPGEKARRRDPKKYPYSGTACPDFRKGTCKRGDACPFAHGVFECWLHPSRYRTQLCKDAPTCTRRVCFFAHSLEELRQPQAADGTPLPLDTNSDDLDFGSSDVSPRVNSETGFEAPDMSALSDSDTSVLALGHGALAIPVPSAASTRQLTPLPSPPIDGSSLASPPFFDMHSANTLSSLNSALQGLMINSSMPMAHSPAGMHDFFAPPAQSSYPGMKPRQPGSFPPSSLPMSGGLADHAGAPFGSFRDDRLPEGRMNTQLGKQSSGVPYNLSYSSLDVSWVSVLTEDDGKASMLPYASKTPMWSQPQIST